MRWYLTNEVRCCVANTRATVRELEWGWWNYDTRATKLNRKQNSCSYGVFWQALWNYVLSLLKVSKILRALLTGRMKYLNPQGWSYIVRYKATDNTGNLTSNNLQCWKTLQHAASCGTYNIKTMLTSRFSNLCVISFETKLVEKMDRMIVIQKFKGKPRWLLL